MANILIVDDEKGIRRTLGAFLHDAGHEVVESEDADIALQVLKTQEIDVVVTDIILHRVTGVELLRRIHAEAPQVQVVMMTGEPTLETATESLRMGATDYLVKPITKAAILKVVASAAKLKSLEDMRRRLEGENRAHRENLGRLVEERTRQLAASEARAQELSEFNQAALDALTAHICILAEDGTILAVNRAWLDFAAANPPLSATTGVGGNYLRVCEAAGTEAADAAQEVVRGLRAVAGGELPEFSFEYACASPDTQRWFELRATRFDGPGPVRIVVAHENITARKRVEAELQRSHELYRRAITAANAIPYQKDYGSDTYVFMGEGIKDLTGYGPSEMRSAVWKDMILETVFLGNAAGLTVAEAGRRAVAGQIMNWRADHRIRTRNGEIRWISDSSIPILTADGKYLGSLGILQDITERKQAESALRESERHLTEAQRLAHLGSWVTELRSLDDFHQNPLRWSDEVFRIFGYEPGAVVITHDMFSQAVHPEDRIRVRDAVQQALRDRKPYQIEHRIVRPDGTERVVQEHAEIVIDQVTGLPGKLIGTVQDITERKAQETIREALLSLGSRLSAATTAIEVARSTFATADRFWKWDTGALDVLRPGEDLARSVLCLDVVEGERREVPPNVGHGEPTPRMRRVMAGGAELVLRTPGELGISDSIVFGDTARLSASLMCVPIRRLDASVGVLSIQSYTLNAFTQQDLRILQGLADYCGGALERIQKGEQLRKLARAVEQASVSIVITDREGIIEFVNPKFTEVTGYTTAEVLGKNPRVLKSGEVPTEAYRQLWKTITAGEEWRGEFHNRRKDGTLYWEAASVSAIRNAAGEITHFVAVKEDITDKKQMETNFLRAQRLEGIGALASGIAHDLNNILAPVLMIAPLLRETVPDADGRAMLGTIESCAQRGADIIKQLLTFARGATGTRVPLPAGHLLRDMAKIIRETFPRDISARLETAKDLWPLLGDATQVHQALMNLCVNARDAMPDGGTLTLEAKNVMVDEAFAAMTPGARPGPHVCVSVSDTGTGITPENLDRIFDPFFTTKEIGKGTGLGLATVLGIARGHEGFVQVTSQWGKGTTFELYFPAAPQSETAGSSNSGAPPRRGQGELILVVDDEPSVRESVRRTLEVHGYRVICATQGAEGLALYTEHRTEVRAVLTDMMMPVMSGPAMIAALRHLYPRLLILGMTGLPEWSNFKGLDQLQLSVMLTKPFRADELLQVLNEALKLPTTMSPGGASE
jgi:PAS domain S-box-containing protein